MKIEASQTVSSEFITALIDEYVLRMNEKISYKGLLISILIAVLCGFCFNSIIAACTMLFAFHFLYALFIAINAEREFVSYLVDLNISPYILNHSYVLREFGDKESLRDKIILSMSKEHKKNLETLHSQLCEKQIIQLSPPIYLHAPLEVHVTNKSTNRIFVDEHGITQADEGYISWDEVFDVYFKKSMGDEGQSTYFIIVILNSSYMSKRHSHSILLNDMEERIVPIELWMRAQVPKYKVTLAANRNW
jgi:hypothetical protein